MSRRLPLRACALLFTLLAALVSVASAQAAELPADDSFGDNGAVVAPLGDDLASSGTPVTAQAPDGDLLTATVTQAWRTRGAFTPSGLVLLRTDPSGAADTGFADAGELRVDGLEGDVSEIRVLADGTIALLGYDFFSGGWVVHVSPAGAVTQRTFSKPVDCDFVGGAALRSDGRAVVVFICDGEHLMQVVDPAGASTPTPLTETTTGSAQRLVIDASGRLVVAFNEYGEEDTTIVRRYSAGGVYDEAFGDVTLPANVTALLLDPQGRIVVATYDCCGSLWNLFRLGSGGEPDDSFDGDGRLVLEDERLGNSGPEHLRSAPGGKLLVTGYLGTGTGNGYVVLRLNDDGSRDESFGPGGIMEFDPERRMRGFGAAIAQADGNVVVSIGFGPFMIDARATVPDSGNDAAEVVLLRFGTARTQQPQDPEDPEQPRQPVQPQQQASSTPPVTMSIPSTSPRTARKCLSRRYFTIRVRPKRVRSAVVRVAGKRVKVRRIKGRLTAKVDLRKLRQATFRVSVASTDRRGRKHRETRSYRTCRVGTNGPKVKGGSTIVTIG